LAQEATAHLPQQGDRLATIPCLALLLPQAAVVAGRIRSQQTPE
jgi:hypothetical protein